MTASTQIGGKYHKDDDRLFRLKKILQAADVSVSHPIADRIVYSQDGQGYAFDPSKTSFHDVETDYYNSIATSDFHTVNNVFLSNEGYIGESAALEMAYAMLYRRPIVIMHPPRFKQGLDTVLEDILKNRQSKFEVRNMHSLEPEAVRALCSDLRGRSIDYVISPNETELVLDKVKQLFLSISANEA